MNDQITWVYQAEDYDPAELAAFEQSITRRYAALSEPRGFDFRVINANELVPASVGKPVLRRAGEDLLERRQCFIVEDMSTDPQGLHALRAVYRTVAASDSVLLNRSFTGPDYLERDKLALIHHAAALGVPTIPTVAVPPGRYARRVLPEVRELLPSGGRLIVKPRELSGGNGVLLVSSEQQLAAALDIVAQSDSAYVLQPYLEHRGDMRVYVADGEVVCSLTRQPKQDGYLASVGQGGSIDVNQDHRLVREHCERVARSLEAEWLCVDWLMTADGPVLNEWSTAHGGFTMMPEPERTVVADAFFGWIRRRFAAGATAAVGTGVAGR